MKGDDTVSYTHLPLFVKDTLIPINQSTVKQLFRRLKVQADIQMCIRDRWCMAQGLLPSESEGQPAQAQYYYLILATNIPT